ncbi:hypothetical protein MTO96_000032 [Rhipicephalus appendiculatus]
MISAGPFRNSENERNFIVFFVERGRSNAKNSGDTEWAGVASSPRTAAKRIRRRFVLGLLRGSSSMRSLTLKPEPSTSTVINHEDPDGASIRAGQSRPRRRLASSPDGR